MCLSSDERSPSDDLCDLNTKPRQEKSCHLSACPRESPSLQIGDNNVHREVSTYYWRTGLWGKCSQTCGGGIRRRQVACYDAQGKHSQDCDFSQKPADTSHCNTDPCPYWILGDWSQCSSTCGKGIQTRLVQCIDYNKAPLTKERCVLPMPDNMKRCKSISCINWVWTPWSQCSTTCGVGTQTRTTQCRRGSKIVSDKECDHIPKPTTEVKMCKRMKCAGFYWKKQKWTKCSSTCGKGFKTREVTCQTGSKTVDEKFCSHIRKPKEKRKCHQYQCALTWMTTPWSECSQRCGKGIQTRNATCHRVNAYKWINPDPIPRPNSSELWCKMDDKPSVTRGCNLGNCTENIWAVGEWSSCNVKCGTGRQRRRVYCHTPEGKRISSARCDLRFRPQRRRRCHERPCSAINCQDIQKRLNITQDGEQELFLRGRYLTIYCARMNSSQPQEYVTLIRGDQDNYSEVYNRRLTNPDTCPFGGSRYDACNCVTDESIGPGLTTFSRISINVTSLAVFTQDWTYAQTHGLHPIPFGESGDCYSRTSCPQGRFSLSLLGTGFVVSPLTKWVAHGNNPSSRIRWLERGQVIQGKCGGFCGRCSPDSPLGLMLEVAPP